MNHRLQTHMAAAAACAVIAAVAFSPSAQAGVVNHADVNGIRTFQDTGTGRIWADLDQFLVAGALGPVLQYSDRTAYMAALNAAGFLWAGTADVMALTGSVPVWTAAGFQDALDVMSTDFGSVIGMVSGYAEAGPGSVMQWDSTTLGWNGFFNMMPNHLNDTGIWAYYGGSVGGGGSVPEPGSLLLAAAALALLSGQRRKAC